MISGSSSDYGFTLLNWVISGGIFVVTRLYQWAERCSASVSHRYVRHKGLIFTIIPRKVIHRYGCGCYVSLKTVFVIRENIFNKPASLETKIC